MTGYRRAATSFRMLAVLAVAATGWLAGLGHPWWAALASWVAFLGVFLGGRCHTAHRRTIAHHTTRTRRTTNPEKETTTR